jgi:hypothetical protein
MLFMGTSQAGSLPQLSFYPGYKIAWSSCAVGSCDAVGSLDTGLSRISAGVIGVGNGTAGDFSATIKAAALIPGVLYSAAGTPLPSCAVGIKGEQAVVSDATLPTYMGAYTSGGGITAAVICSYNGTTYAWLMH